MKSLTELARKLRDNEFADARGIIADRVPVSPPKR